MLLDMVSVDQPLSYVVQTLKRFHKKEVCPADYYVHREILSRYHDGMLEPYMDDPWDEALKMTYNTSSPLIKAFDDAGLVGPCVGAVDRLKSDALLQTELSGYSLAKEPLVFRAIFI